MKRLRKTISILISIVIFIACLGVCVVFQENQQINMVQFIFRVEDNIQERVSLFYKDDIYYAFLPSYVDFAAMQIQYTQGYYVYVDDKLYESEAYCSALETDKQYTLKIENGLGRTISEDTLIIKKTGQIAAMSLHLADGSLEQINADENVSKSGMMLLVDEQKQTNYYGDFKKLQGRGNSTWSQAKKSYSLDFTTDVNLLDMGLGKKWVLLGNALDESGLRNKLVYDAAKQFGVNFAVDSRYIDLYVDAQYMGLYLLTEQIEVATNRVEITDLLEKTQAVNQASLSNYAQIEKTENGKVQRGFDIPKNPIDITGGYLFQIEHHDYRINTKPSVIQTDSLSFSLTSPRYASKEQIAYLSEYCNRIETDIINGDLSGLDIESFVIYYLIQELFANTDNCSFFFYKDSDAVDAKLYAGPIWDFDLSLRNGWQYSDFDPKLLERNNDNWFNYLTQNAEFDKAVKAYYWNELRPVLEEFIEAALSEYCAQIDRSFQANKIRWKNEYLYNNLADTCQKHFDTIAEHKDSITSFMRDRLQFFDSLWGTEDTYCVLSFDSVETGAYFKSYYVKEGEKLDFTPNPTSAKTKGYTFSGWYDQNGNPYSAETAVVQNARYYATWEKDTKTSDSDDTPMMQRISKKQVVLIVLIVVILGFIAIEIMQARAGRKRKRGER